MDSIAQSGVENMKPAMIKKLCLALMIAGMMLSSAYLVMSEPEGVKIVSNSSYTKNITPATSLATEGGSFTTLILNGTFQNPRWKAFVGNISGSLTLDDSSNKTIYDWEFAIITGEVYASRSNSIAWSNIGCVDDTVLSSEEAAINFNTTKVDSINNTFNKTVHAGFMVAGTQISSSSCRAIATYVSDSAQASSESADFQEILLDDDSVVVYTTLLENDAVGYDGTSTYDFQMIVPDDETSGVDTTYYFYAELG